MLAFWNAVCNDLPQEKRSKKKNEKQKNAIDGMDRELINPETLLFQLLPKYACIFGMDGLDYQHFLLGLHR